MWDDILFRYDFEHPELYQCPPSPPSSSASSVIGSILEGVSELAVGFKNGVVAAAASVLGSAAGSEEEEDMGGILQRPHHHLLDWILFQGQERWWSWTPMGNSYLHHPKLTGARNVELTAGANAGLRERRGTRTGSTERHVSHAPTLDAPELSTISLTKNATSEGLIRQLYFP